MCHIKSHISSSLFHINVNTSQNGNLLSITTIKAKTIKSYIFYALLCKIAIVCPKYSGDLKNSERYCRTLIQAHV